MSHVSTLMAESLSGLAILEDDNIMFAWLVSLLHSKIKDC